MLSTAFKGSRLFDPEAIGGWKRDTVREVGIVTGCLLLAPRALWRELGGFDTRFFMYGEDADLGMRAWAQGLRPAITPDAVITHEIGVSSASRPDKLVLLFRGKATLLRKHWSPLAASHRDRAPLARRRRSRAAGALGPVARGLVRAPELGQGIRAGRATTARGRSRPRGGEAVRPRRTLAYALKWAVVMNSGRRVMSTVFTFLLAALLGPHDFGVVAVALVFVAFVRMLLEQGFMTAIIQREDLDDAHLDSAFWLNLSWCVVLAGGCAFVAGWWADVNDMPELGPVIQVLSLMIVMDGLQIVQQAVMERQLDFKRLAIRTNISVLLGGAVGIPLALAGAGVWALVGQQLAMELALVTLIWGMTTWHPRFRFSPSHARDLLGFSVSVFAANLAGFLNRRGDALLIGIFFGPVAVGVYRIADRVVDVVLDVTMRPIGLVALPVLSRLQTTPAELHATIVRLLRTTMLATVPVLAVIFACSDEVLAVLGESWEPGADALKLLCLVGIGKAISFYTGPVLFAASRPRFRAVMLWIVAIVSTATVVLVGAALAGASVPTQVVGMAGSRAVLFLPILVPVNLLIVAHITGLRLRSLAACGAGAAPRRGRRDHLRARAPRDRDRRRARALPGPAARRRRLRAERSPRPALVRAAGPRVAGAARGAGPRRTARPPARSRGRRVGRMTG